MSAEVTFECHALDTLEPDERISLSVSWQRIEGEEPNVRWGFMFDIEGWEREPDKTSFKRAWQAAFCMTEVEARTLAAYLPFALAHRDGAA